MNPLTSPRAGLPLNARVTTVGEPRVGQRGLVQRVGAAFRAAQERGAGTAPRPPRRPAPRRRPRRHDPARGDQRQVRHGGHLAPAAPAGRPGWYVPPAGPASSLVKEPAVSAGLGALHAEPVGPARRRGRPPPASGHRHQHDGCPRPAARGSARGRAAEGEADHGRRAGQQRGHLRVPVIVIPGRVPAARPAGRRRPAATPGSRRAPRVAGGARARTRSRRTARPGLPDRADLGPHRRGGLVAGGQPAQPARRAAAVTSPGTDGPPAIGETQIGSLLSCRMRSRESAAVTWCSGVVGDPLAVLPSDHCRRHLTG